MPTHNRNAFWRLGVGDESINLSGVIGCSVVPNDVDSNGCENKSPFSSFIDVKKCYCSTDLCNCNINLCNSHWHNTESDSVALVSLDISLVLAIIFMMGCFI